MIINAKMNCRYTVEKMTKDFIKVAESLVRLRNEI